MISGMYKRGKRRRLAAGARGHDPIISYSGEKKKTGSTWKLSRDEPERSGAKNQAECDSRQKKSFARCIRATRSRQRNVVALEAFLEERGGEVHRHSSQKKFTPLGEEKGPTPSTASKKKKKWEKETKAGQSSREKKGRAHACSTGKKKTRPVGTTPCAANVLLCSEVEARKGSVHASL